MHRRANRAVVSLNCSTARHVPRTTRREQRTWAATFADLSLFRHLRWPARNDAVPAAARQTPDIARFAATPSRGWEMGCRLVDDDLRCRGVRSQPKAPDTPVAGHV